MWPCSTAVLARLAAVRRPLYILQVVALSFAVHGGVLQLMSDVCGSLQQLQMQCIGQGGPDLFTYCLSSAPTAHGASAGPQWWCLCCALPCVLAVQLCLADYPMLGDNLPCLGLLGLASSTVLLSLLLSPTPCLRNTAAADPYTSPGPTHSMPQNSSNRPF